jgi:hypothetical protein
VRADILENVFGFVRMESREINTPKQMQVKIAHTDLVKEALRILEIADHVPGRANLGGVRLPATPDKFIYEIMMANGMQPKPIAEICLKAVHVREGTLGPEQQIAFLQFMDYSSLVQPAGDQSVTNSQMNQRIILGFGTRIVTLLTNTHHNDTMYDAVDDGNGMRNNN